MKPPTQRKHRGKLGPRGRTVTATRHFESLARELHASDIYVGLQTGADGMLVWIVDRYARLREDMVIDFDRETGAWVLDKTASEWVHAMALKLFPDSPVTADSVREVGAERRHGANWRLLQAGAESSPLRKEPAEDGHEQG